MHEKVCAVVSTFNRKKLLMECLGGLLSQTYPLSGIIVVDGPSTDGTPEALLEKGFIPKLPDKKKERVVIEKKVKDKSGRDVDFVYIRLNKDVGGAGQFYEGVKEAFSREYDWIWIMDDDVEPLENTLEELLKYKKISKCIHPIEEFPDGISTREAYVDPLTGFYVRAPLRKKEKGWMCTNVMHFEGVLVHKKLVEKIGFPNPNLFIGKDDISYGIKAMSYTNPVVVFSAVIKKKRGSVRKKIFETKSKRLEYYYTRNHAYLVKEIAETYSVSKKTLIFFYFLLFLKKIVISMATMRLGTLVSVIKGFIDGLKYLKMLKN